MTYCLEITEALAGYGRSCIVHIHTARLAVGKPRAMRISKGLQRQTLAAYVQDGDSAGMLCRSATKIGMSSRKGGGPGFHGIFKATCSTWGWKRRCSCDFLSLSYWASSRTFWSMGGLAAGCPSQFEIATSDSVHSRGREREKYKLQNPLNPIQPPLSVPFNPVKSHGRSTKS